MSISRGSPEELDEAIDVKYKEVEKYMRANKLILNSEKTQLLVMATPQQQKQHQNYGVILDTGIDIPRQCFFQNQQIL